MQKKFLQPDDEITGQTITKILEGLEYTESTFTKIMYATTVEEMLAIPAEPEELLSYFEALEHLGALEEEAGLYQEGVSQRIKEACPVRTGRRALFI